MATARDYTAATADDWEVLEPGVDRTVFELGSRIRRVSALLLERVEAAVVTAGFAVYGDYEIAAILYRTPDGLQPRDLAARLRVTRAGITGRLDRLQADGLVVRNRDRDDGRSIIVSLTGAGRNAVSATFAAVMQSQVDFFDGLSEAKKATLSAHLATLIEPLDPTP